MMELTEQKYGKKEGKLPKNIRQIGEPGQGTKILIEDYAYTFLHQMAEENLTCIKTAVLVGEMNESVGIYIRGALEIDMGQEVKDWFSHEHWRDIFRAVQEWFQGQEVVGWYMANPGFPPVLTEELRKIHSGNFSGNRYVFFQMDVLENEEIFYICGENGLAPLCGYYIYYEKNEQMQTYMSQKRGGAGIETEGILRDRAAARFRNVMQERKEQNVQKKMLAVLYTSCTFLVMVILVIGITMVNNYDRMTNMEDAIHQISESLGNSEEVNTESEETDDLEAAASAENQQALAKAEEEKEPEAIPEEDTEPEPEPEEVPEEEAPEEVPEPQEEVQEAMSQAVQEPERYQIQVGDTLMDICRVRYGTEDMVSKVCEVNGLEDKDKIYVGEIILLP